MSKMPELDGKYAYETQIHNSSEQTSPSPIRAKE